MCGIIAFLGLVSGSKQCLDGIKMLQNRGYDSSGICSIGKDVSKFKILKYASIKDKSAVELLEEEYDNFKDDTIMCLHTRWATTGAKTDINAHPHIDYSNKFCIVHNGIIENYKELRKELIGYGISFKSQTDSEVIANLIGHYYSVGHGAKGSIKDALNRLEGTWGLSIICLDTPDKLYCARHGSPLLVGFNDEYYMVASEQSGFCHYVDNYICLKNGDFITLEKGNNMLKADFGEYTIKKVLKDDIQLTPYPFEHWTLKEIYEQHDSSLRAMGNGGRIVDDCVRLGGLNNMKNELKKVDNLILLGCGTSYNSGLYSLKVFKKICNFNTVQIFDGGEFSIHDIPKQGKTAIIFLSQSGETKDLHRCLEMVRDLEVVTIGVINVVDSLIAREVHCGVYLNAGREVGVASTKAFTSQVIVLYLIACWFSQITNINKLQRISIINSLRRLPMDIRSVINSCRGHTKAIAKYLKNKNSLFILGKGINESVAKEGALKIKEIGYIHADGYSSTSLKHGSYAILDDKFPVILLNTNDEFFIRNNGVADELKVRDSYLIGISDNDLDGDKYDIAVKIPNCNEFNGLLCNVVLQLIGYDLSKEKGHNVDQPKHLAKCCNVD